MSPSWLKSRQRRDSKDYSLLEKRPSWQKRSASCRSKLILPVAGVLAVVLIILTFSGHDKTQNATSYFANSMTDAANSAKSASKYMKLPSSKKNVGRLKHIISPADKGNADVCKFVLSAAVNDYETITLFNWHKTGDKMAKISGGLEYMKSFDSSHDNELLLIADGFDEWFQLPASIMEARFHEINRRENERVLARTGKAYRQNIIISTQRQCWPGSGADVSCYTAPESSLPAFIFGPQTDNMVEGWNTYAHLRPRYLNAGYTMGTVKAMRQLWLRAQERSEANPNQVGLDQNVLATIWGEQNYMREYDRFNGAPLNSVTGNSQGVTTKLSKRDFPESKPNEPRKVFNPVEGTNYEFGIGLDYGLELSLPTVFAEYDAWWLTFSNKTSLDRAFTTMNVTNPGATGLQSDIAALPPPFHSLLSATKDGKSVAGDLSKLAESLSWNDTSIFTNMWTGITPAIIHHNAWRDDLKDRRESTWQFMWFQPYARQLLDAGVATRPRTSFLKSKMSAKFKRYLGGQLEAFEPPRRLGAKTDNTDEGNWVSWDNLCSEKDQEEVFRDGKGPWVGAGGAESKKKEKPAMYVLHNEPSRRR